MNSGLVILSTLASVVIATVFAALAWAAARDARTPHPAMAQRRLRRATDPPPGHGARGRATAIGS